MIGKSPEVSNFNRWCGYFSNLTGSSVTNHRFSLWKSPTSTGGVVNFSNLTGSSVTNHRFSLSSVRHPSIRLWNSIDEGAVTPEKYHVPSLPPHDTLGLQRI
jgi:hypothetical protein